LFKCLESSSIPAKGTNNLIAIDHFYRRDQPEAVWWCCHRRITADYLLAAGAQVMHILETWHVDVASLTPGAVVCNDGTLVYPAVAELLRPEPDQS
jgi:uncharacterized protein (DUF488 family)